jgi:dienelactone hydrolase
MGEFHTNSSSVGSLANRLCHFHDKVVDIFRYLLGYVVVPSLGNEPASISVLAILVAEPLEILPPDLDCLSDAQAREKQELRQHQHEEEPILLLAEFLQVCKQPLQLCLAWKPPILVIVRVPPLVVEVVLGSPVHRGASWQLWTRSWASCPRGNGERRRMSRRGSARLSPGPAAAAPGRYPRTSSQSCIFRDGYTGFRTARLTKRAVRKPSVTLCCCLVSISSLTSPFSDARIIVRQNGGHMKKRRIVLAAVAAIALIAAASLHAQEWVEFRAMDEWGEALQLKGILTVPSGKGPFPALIMLPECHGLKEPVVAKQQQSWADRLASWGYASLQLDSLGPRGLNDVCAGDLAGTVGSADAFAAKAYLSGLSFIDQGKVAVVGWSYGAWAIMYVVDSRYRDTNVKPFRAAVAFYPYCTPSQRRDTPLMILIGEKDSMFSSCKSRNDGRLNGADYELRFVVYPNTTHVFDYEGINVEVQGEHMEYNPAATADAIIQTRDFLAKYLKTEP